MAQILCFNCSSEAARPEGPSCEACFRNVKVVGYHPGFFEEISFSAKICTAVAAYKRCVCGAATHSRRCAAAAASRSELRRYAPVFSKRFQFSFSAKICTAAAAAAATHGRSVDALPPPPKQQQRTVSPRSQDASHDPDASLLRLIFQGT